MRTASLTCESMRTGRAFSLGLCAALACASQSIAQWPCYYKVEIVNGPPCTDYPDGKPVNLLAGNELGQPAGTWTCGGITFPWIGADAPSGSVLSIPPNATGGAVLAINDVMGNTTPSGTPFGQLAGRSHISPNDRTWLYDDDAYTILPMIPNATASFAEGINNTPMIVGYTGNFVTGDPPNSACLWKHGVIYNLNPDLDGPRSRAHGTANSGHVTGWTGELIFSAWAFVWHEGKSENLPYITGGTSSQGAAMNNLGHVAGIGGLVPPGETSTVLRSFLWRDGEMTLLGVLPGFQSMRATDINDHDEIVGNAQQPLVGNQPRPFIWRNGVIANVNEMLDPDYTGLSANIAVANTNDGIIYVKLTVGGAKLTPVYGPFGDVNCDGVVNVHDLLKLLTHWGTVGETDLDAARCDLDENGIVNVFDLLLLLSNWGATK